jgi:hypothetical protein
VTRSKWPRLGGTWRRVDVIAEAAFGSPGRGCLPPRNWPENVGSRFPSLLQTPERETFSADFWTRKKPNCRKHSADKLGSSLPERYSQFVPERRSLSEAWDLAHLLYKLV